MKHHNIVCSDGSHYMISTHRYGHSGFLEVAALDPGGNWADDGHTIYGSAAAIAELEVALSDFREPGDD